jgi:uncharacterized protein (DUF58 family)
LIADCGLRIGEGTDGLSPIQSAICNLQSAIRNPMFSFFSRKKSFRFVLISAMLTAAAIGVALISAVAGQIGEYELASLGSKAAIGLALVIVLYVVPRLAQSLSLSSEFSIHLPNAGLLFFALILMVTILSLSSGNNLLYLVLAVLLSTMFVSWVASRLDLHHLTVSVRFPNHIFAGESVPFDIAVSNRKRLLPAFSLAVAMWEQDAASEPDDASVPARLAEMVYLPIVPAKTEARARVSRSFVRRGVYPVNGFFVRTRFPFGFIEQRRFIETKGEVVVYPQPQPLDDFRQVLPMLQGQIESRVKGSGSDLYAIRQYLSSDHHHHIDWKATAKTARLMVREYTRDDDWRVTIAFDPRVEKELAATPEFAERFERAITLAASLTSHLIKEGAELRLLAAESETGFGVGRAHSYKLFNHLARVAPITDADGSDKRNQIWQADDHLKIVIASAARDPLTNHPMHLMRVIHFEEL